MKKIILHTLFLQICYIASAQQINVIISPETTYSIEGHSVLDRSKYLNICHNGVSFESAIGNTEISYRYINDLKICFGRALGMVQPANVYTKNLKEDPLRSGFADLT
jgi:hypothetical protein